MSTEQNTAKAVAPLLTIKCQADRLRNYANMSGFLHDLLGYLTIGMLILFSHNIVTLVISGMALGAYIFSFIVSEIYVAFALSENVNEMVASAVGRVCTIASACAGIFCILAIIVQVIGRYAYGVA